MAGKAVAAGAPAKKTTDTVIEYVLRNHLAEDDIRPVMSDHDLEVVKHARIQGIHDARLAGMARPDLRIGKRTCTYPLSSQGKRLADGSTCDEEEV